LDGLQYTFNGWGEYTMIKIDNSNVTYFNIYRQYIFYQDLNYFHEYLIQRFLKSGGTKYNFRRVKVPSTAPKWGEYTMIKIDNSNVTFELQTRTDLATSKNGTDIKKINATIFSGFAAKEDGNASIRVELDNNLECKRFCLLSVII
jgi:hypothetical protein